MTAVIEGDHGVGMVGCMKAMRLAIGKAREGGIGIVLTVRNNHFLAAAPYCLEAAKAGMVGIAFSNTKPTMGYPGARGRAIGNSPLGFGIPTAAGFPILFDASLTISGGRLRQWIREGRRIPAGLQGVDGDGRPSDDPRAVLVGGTPMPIGGHKGAGLAILVEVLTGVLGGAAFLSGITPPGGDLRDKSRAMSQCCIAIDVEAFMPLKEFESRMAEFVADLKDHPLEEGAGRSARRASAWSGRDWSARPAASRWSRTCARPWRPGRSAWAWTSPMDDDYRLRGAVEGDLDRIGEIIREAWEPIFALHEQSWGEELFEFLYANGAERSRRTWAATWPSTRSGASLCRRARAGRWSPSSSTFSTRNGAWGRWPQRRGLGEPRSGHRHDDVRLRTRTASGRRAWSTPGCGPA